ncbi:MAG: hypothetical protein MZV70_37890 [Desulfobacterales bacterium]|nr:hypothetical protein [Desulfobacterales bacterium]
MKIIFSDPRGEIPCWHGNGLLPVMKTSCRTMSPDDKNFSKIAHVALANKADVIAICSRADRIDKISLNFMGYKEIREFNDKDKSDQNIALSMRSAVFSWRITGGLAI